MTEFAIIGGTGLATLQELEITRREVVYTPYGEPSGPFTHGRLFGTEAVFLARHGHGHTIPPHKVNYRANIWALKEIGVKRILAVAAVGGIRSDMAPGKIAFPHQLIDYTHGRDHTFFETDQAQVTHIDFTDPYSESVRGKLIEAARAADVDAVENGCYGAAQGPRLETRAEIDRMERDGCDVVGMTGMPEAALAREAELPYACCAVVANWAAGRGPTDIHEGLEDNLREGMTRVSRLLEALLPRI